VAKGGMRSALASRDLRLMLAALACSRAGDLIFSIALIVYVLQQTGSAAWVAALMALRLLPVLVVGPLAGVLADRVPRRRLMVGADLVRLALMLVTLGLVAADAPLGAIIAVTVLAGVAGTPYLPALTASLPRVVDERSLAGANALVSVVDYVATVLGPAVGAVVAATWGLSAALVVNAVSFGLSALFLAGLRGRVDAPAAAEVSTDPGDETAAGAWAQLWQELSDGLRAVTADPVLRTMVAAIVLSALAFGFELVYTIFISRDLLGTGASGVGWLDAAVGVGGVAGAWFASRLADTNHPRRTMAWLSVGSIVPMGVLAFVTVPAVAYALLFVEGAASVCLDVVGVTTMQRSVDDELLARADALIGSAAVSASVMGSMLAPLLQSVFGLRGALVVASLVPAAAVLVLLAKLRTPAESVEDHARRADVRALLDRIGPLTDLAPTEREQIAVAARSVLWLRGETVTSQGDAPDAVWLLAAGECEIRVRDELAGSRVVATTAAPDVIGEIGVVEQRPRTATVVALSDCSAFVVPATVFREALSVGDAELPVLRTAIGSRLARSLAS
jgi:MFS family permease